ncbi:helix-turn-helix transcriptional regulator [Lentisalinibacter orientalis]|uniref:helix-turn-helix transcriptional regulator n=1 Tax=Lentisalinibacter orientalis TaxID=2992241 RepID=UPI0038692441
MAGTLGSIISEETWDDLVGRIYDCAIDGRQWANTLIAMGEPVRAPAGQLTCVGIGTGDTFEDVVTGLPNANAMAEFEELVSRGEQLRVNHAATVEEFEPIYDYRHTSEAEMRRSLFYQEHAIPLDVAYYAGTVLQKDRKRITGVVHFRPKSAGHFQPEEIAYLMRLAPHVRRSIELSLQISEEATIRTAECLLESLRCAGLVIDDHYRIIAANDLATAMLRERDGITDEKGHLDLRDAVAAESLLRALGATLAGRHAPTTMENPAIRADRPSGRTAYRLYVCPLQRRLDPFQRRFAVVLVVDPENSDVVSHSWLRNEYGLTAAESGVAALLVAGHSLAEIAAMRRCGLETIRSQVKQVLAKTGCSRQAELVSRLLRASSVPIDPGVT